jgi:hypothetical protein
MAQTNFLTAQEVSERWGGAVTVGTLANWRARGFGPPYQKLGAAVRYPLAQLEAWEAQQTQLTK